MRRWPEDDATRVRELYLRALLTQDFSAIEKEASGYLTKNPWDGVARSTVALSQLKQGRASESLRTLTEFQSDIPASAISVPVHVAALAANGWREKAQEEGAPLMREPILPEERALVSVAVGEK